MGIDVGMKIPAYVMLYDKNNPDKREMKREYDRKYREEHKDYFRKKAKEYGLKYERFVEIGKVNPDEAGENHYYDKDVDKLNSLMTIIMKKVDKISLETAK